MAKKWPGVRKGRCLTWIPHSIHSERKPTTDPVLIAMQQKWKQALSSDYADQLWQEDTDLKSTEWSRKTVWCMMAVWWISIFQCGRTQSALTPGHMCLNIVRNREEQLLVSRKFLLERKNKNDATNPIKKQLMPEKLHIILFPAFLKVTSMLLLFQVWSSSDLIEVLQTTWSTQDQTCLVILLPYP